MQLAEINSWMGLPLELFTLVHHKACSTRLSEVDKTLYTLSRRVTESICLYPGTEPGQKDVLVELLKRYSNIRTLYIGKNRKRFGPKEEKHLRVLIAYLKAHPLAHVKNLVIHEVEGTGEFESREINRLLMDSLSHQKLETISIQLLYETSVLTGTEIQPMLEKPLNLKKFKLRCHPTNHPTIALTFAKQRHLITAELLEFCAPMSTLESIKACPRLRSLNLTNGHSPKAIKQLLSDKPSKRLNRLILPGIPIDSDEGLEAITKAHPNLRTLQITLGNVTECGFKTIGTNCTHLRSLSFIYPNATDESLDLLSSNMPFLEEISIGRGFNVTGTGVAAVARNCTKLRVLKLFRIKGLDEDSVKAITEHCKNLTHLEIGFSGAISLKNIRHFALNLTNLKFFKISNISGISQEDHIKLKTEFPFLK